MERVLPTRSEFRFCHPLRVRWSEVDAQRVVFNPHYLAYVDVGLTEYQRAIGWTYPDALARHGADQFAVRAEVEYLASAHYDEELELGVRAEYLGRTSYRMLTGIFRGTQLLTVVRMTYVVVSLDERKPMPMIDEYVRAVLAYEHTPPTRK